MAASKSSLLLLNFVIERRWFDLFTADGKRGGICIYYKETLTLKMILIPYLNESFLCEGTIGSKKCVIGTVYRSSSQNSDKFESFLSNFEFLLQDISNRNPYLTLLLGDYNARNTKW